MKMHSWLRQLLLVAWLVVLTACGTGGTTTALNPPIPQGDFALAIQGSTWNVGVQFPPRLAGDRSQGSSIPFGTEVIEVEASSETPGIAYEGSLSLTRERPSGVLQAVPPQASIRVQVEALSGMLGEPSGGERLVLATASAVVPPQSRGPVVLRLIPASFLPLLQEIIPNPVPVGGSILLVGENLDQVSQVIFTGPANSRLPVVVEGNPSVIPVPVPLGAVSGPVIALDGQGFGVGSVDLQIIGIPSPSPTPTVPPTADPVSITFEGVVEEVHPALADNFSPGQVVRGGYTFDPNTLPLAGSTSAEATFEALIAVLIEVDEGYQLTTDFPGTIRLIRSLTSSHYSVLAQNLIGEPIGELLPRFLILEFLDSTATAIPDASILPPDPAALNFDTKRFRLQFGIPDSLETVEISGPIESLFGIPTPPPTF